jgi:hypothetical protein
VSVIDDTALRDNPRTDRGTTHGWVGFGEVVGRLGKNKATDACPFCDTPYKKHEAGDAFLFAPHDDCCETRAAQQVWRFSRHAHDDRLPKEEREEHGAFLARMLEVTRRLEPAKRPTVTQLYNQAFGTHSLADFGAVKCAYKLKRLLEEHGWLPEGTR